MAVVALPSRFTGLAAISMSEEITFTAKSCCLAVEPRYEFPFCAFYFGPLESGTIGYFANICTRRCGIRHGIVALFDDRLKFTRKDGALCLVSFLRSFEFCLDCAVFSDSVLKVSPQFLQLAIGLDRKRAEALSEHGAFVSGVVAVAR